MILDGAVILLFLIFGWIGLRRGFMISAIMMVKTSFSIIIAIVLAGPIADFLNSSFGLAGTCANLFKTSAGNGKLILIALVVLLIVVLIQFILFFLRKLGHKAREIKIVRGADSILGFVFGILRFGFMFCILSFVVYIVTALPFLGGLKASLFKDSVVALWLYELVTDLILVKALGAAAGLVKI